MTLGLHRPGRSPVHRLGAGPKLLLLLLSGTGLFFVAAPVPLALALLATLGLFALAGFGARTVWAQLRPVAAIVALLALAQGFLAGWEAALATLLRLLALLLLASLVTLTTPTEAVIAVFERLCAPLARFGVRPRRVGLVFSLTLRFIPVIARLAGEVREAQAARGLERSVVALAVPLLVRMLKTADEVAEAIEARGFDPPAADGGRKGERDGP